MEAFGDANFAPKPAPKRAMNMNQRLEFVCARYQNRRGFASNVPDFAGIRRSDGNTVRLRR